MTPPSQGDRLQRRLVPWTDPYLIFMFGGAPKAHAVSYENTGGVGVFFPFWNISPSSHPPHPRSFFSYTYELQIPQLLSFDIHALDGGGYESVWVLSFWLSRPQHIETGWFGRTQSVGTTCSCHRDSCTPCHPFTDDQNDSGSS